MAEESRKHLKALVADFTTAMLVTRGPSGELRSRPMEIAEAEHESEMWFITGKDSPKVDELAKDPHVVVTLQSGDAFVSLSGIAEVRKDRAKIEALWKEEWKVWFPKGKDDPEISLLCIHVSTAEFWDSKGTKGIRYLVASAKAFIEGKKPTVPQDMHGTVKA